MRFRDDRHRQGKLTDALRVRPLVSRKAFLELSQRKDRRKPSGSCRCSDLDFRCPIILDEGIERHHVRSQ